MMQITTRFKNETLGWLTRLPKNRVIDLDTMSHDYKHRVAAIKTIIDWGQDKDNGIEVTFNETYSKIKVQKSLK
jgi:hypothetical protein